jgi:Asp-tRNA(Asn)/Glu-tRNA(Gln) amidotransferase A subunit family amidase
MKVHSLQPGLSVVSAVTLAVFLGACEQPAVVDPGNRVSNDVPFDVVEATIADIQKAIVAGRTSCRAVVESYLERIETFDRPSGLNAITEINPRALGKAVSIDNAVAGGEPLGPLFCAPILVKDNFDTYDLPTTGGSIALAKSVPPDDAFMVRKLREADAIVLAKTNMAEWAFSPRQTISSSYGVTANAYALDRVPAGSSGGTASGVAASFGVAGLGSDTGNSIRGPSSHLALAGIRSTLGLTSRDGVIPLVFDRDVAGPMTRTVEDAARLFDVVAGHDPDDSLSEAGKREESYTAYLKADGLEGARIGVLRAHADPDDTDPEILALFESALDDLRKAGAELIDPIEVPNWSVHAEADSFCGTFRYDMARYLETLGDSAPIRDVKEAFDAGLYSEHARESFEWYLRYPADIAQADWDEPCPVFLDHPARRAFLEDVTTAMNEAAVEALVFPTWRYPPAHLDRGYEDYRGDNSQLIAPSTGMPAITVPMGFTGDHLPAGLHILGRRYSDGLLIQFAYAYEQATKHRRPPAGFPSIQH